MILVAVQMLFAIKRPLMFLVAAKQQQPLVQFATNSEEPSSITLPLPSSSYEPNTSECIGRIVIG